MLGGGYVIVDASRRWGRWKHRGYCDQGRKAEIGHQAAIDHQNNSIHSPRHAMCMPHLIAITGGMSTKFQLLRRRNKLQLAGEGARR
jgi:hypothetical protein